MDDPEDTGFTVHNWQALRVELGKNGMADKPTKGLRNVILVWIIGLTLGVAAGAATALLLLPASGGKLPEGASLADRLGIGD